MLRKIFISLLVILFSGVSYADLTKDNLEKRKKVRYAVSRGILSLYDIPFETYIKLEMWDEIAFIFEANNKNMIKYEFPGLYYSRPYVVNDTIWVFENSGRSDKGIYIFDPDTLKFLKKLIHKDYSKYDSGIRTIVGNTVISGGSDKDVDAAVIWNTDTNEIRTVKLGDGHYVGAIEVRDNMLFIGSCGGVVNAWRYDTLDFFGIYSSSEEENIDWTVFNEKECITNLKVIEDKLIGVGEKTVFTWRIEDRELLRKYPKALSNSIVFFYEKYMIEYKNDKFAVRDLENAKIIRRGKAEKSIEDLIVTSEKILGSHEGELLILALRHNMGLLIYDFKTLKLLKKINTKGETLTTYENTIFATDDRDIYKYDIVNKDAEKYEAFLEKMNPDKIILSNKAYSQLVKRLQDYPEIIEKAEISKKFLKKHGLKIRHSFKYGKIAERFVPNSQDAQEGYREDVYGYKTLYEVKNNSRSHYFVTLAAAWSGEYGKRSSHDNEVWSVEDNTKRGHLEHSFFILPYGAKHKGQFEVGEKEPVNLFIYPMRIEKVSEVYYKGFMEALSNENKDVSLIDKYLGDNLVRNWHGTLKKRKKKLVGDDKNIFDLFNIFK